MMTDVVRPSSGHGVGRTTHRAVLISKRLVKDRDLSETEAMEMIAAQMPAELKRARADFVIDNDGTLAQLEQSSANDAWSQKWLGTGRGGRRNGAGALAFPEFLDTHFWSG